MKLVALSKNKNTVAAVIEDRDGESECPVLKFISEAPAQYQGSAKGFKALFDRYASLGRQGLTTELFHEVHREEGIWEFVKGDLRIFCFLDGGSLVVACHGVLKKTNKADRGAVGQAIAIKHRYVSDKSDGNIVII